MKRPVRTITLTIIVTTRTTAASMMRRAKRLWKQAEGIRAEVVDATKKRSRGRS